MYWSAGWQHGRTDEFGITGSHSISVWILSMPLGILGFWPRQNSLGWKYCSLNSRHHSLIPGSGLEPLPIGTELTLGAIDYQTTGHPLSSLFPDIHWQSFLADTLLSCVASLRASDNATSLRFFDGDCFWGIIDSIRDGAIRTVPEIEVLLLEKVPVSYVPDGCKNRDLSRV
jgi:hypothetical protein